MQQSFLFEKMLPFVTPSPLTPSQSDRVGPILGGLAVVAVVVILILVCITIAYIKRKRLFSHCSVPTESIRLGPESSVHYNTFTQEVRVD